MSDAKVSELPAATTTAAVDSLYLVQSGASKSLTLANLFASIPTQVMFNDKICISDTNLATTRSQITVETNITYISNVDSTGNVSIPDGNAGQIKIVIMVDNIGSHTVTLQGANVARTVAFTSIGDSATLIYTNSKWYPIGGTATVGA